MIVHSFINLQTIFAKECFTANPDMEKLNHKKVFIAGATGAIGRHTAKLIAASGAELFLSGRNKEKLQEVAAECGVKDDHIFELDITDEGQVNEVTAKVLAGAGQMDILINAAGIGLIKPVEQISLKEFMEVLTVNLAGTFLLVKAFLPPMKESKKGLIINIPGILGKVPMAGAAAYSASKYGITGMMQSIRKEIERTNIRITNLYLGGVDSPFWDNIDLRIQRDKMVQAEEAARAIWFLCQQPDSGVVNEMVLQPFNHQVI
jgi:NADP-dependent 3-hydroxy acid dehydrogenase YdfG